YDLTVDGVHDLYVVAGSASLLVHNCTSPNQIQQQINRGQAPRGIVRADRGDPSLEQPHIHIDNGGGRTGALNIDGTWKHGGLDLTADQRKWLTSIGWSLP